MAQNRLKKYYLKVVDIKTQHTYSFLFIDRSIILIFHYHILVTETNRFSIGELNNLNPTERNAWIYGHVQFFKYEN